MLITVNNRTTPCLFSSSKYDTALAAFLNNDFQKAAEYFTIAATQEHHIFAYIWLIYLHSKDVYCCCLDQKTLNQYEDILKEYLFFIISNAWGEPDKKYMLYFIYKGWWGEYKNPMLATTFLTDAAEHFFAPAESTLGYGYNTGTETGINENLLLCKQYYTRAATKNFAPAQLHLSIYYQFDEPNEILRMEWLNKAAANKLAAAQYCLAGSCASSLMSLDLYNVAAHSGHIPSKLKLAELYLARDNPAKAMEIYIELANKGNATAKMMLAEEYERGKHFTVDYQQAFTYYSELANCDDKIIQWSAICRLIKMYKAGRGVTKNYEKAFEYICRIKSAPGFFGRYADIESGLFYLEGLGTEKNVAEAKNIFFKHAPYFNNAAFLLAKYYLTEGSVQDGIRWMQTANELGYLPAAETLGIFYLLGKHVEKDIKQAQILLSKAAKANFQRAQMNLGILFEKEKFDGLKVSIRKAIECYNLCINNQTKTILPVNAWEIDIENYDPNVVNTAINNRERATENLYPLYSSLNTR